MENKLKAETSKIIHILTQSNIRPIMCTGDNLLTGISVARECGMLNNLGQKHKPVVATTNKDVSKIVVVEADPLDTEKALRFISTDGDSDIELAHDSAFNLNKLTASSLSVNSKIHFAVNGNSFEVIRKYYPDIFETLMNHGS